MGRPSFIISPQSLGSMPKSTRASSRPSRAHQAENTHYLSLICREVHRLVVFPALYAPRFETGYQVIAGAALRHLVHDLAAYHELYELALADLGNWQRRHAVTVPEHRYPVAYLEYLLHAVGDIHDADALALQFLDKLEQGPHLAL